MSGGFKVGLNPLSSKGGNGSGQIVQIIKLPQALSNNAKTLRLEGQITQVNNNSNTARIQTAQGDVDVKVPTRGLEQGQRLIIDVPAGRPPRQARIAPEAIVRPPENNAPRASNTSRGENITIRTPQPPPPQAQPSLTQKVIQKISQKLSAGTPPPQNLGEQSEGRQISQQNQSITRGSTSQNTADQAQKIAQQIAAQAIKNIPDMPQPLKPNDVVRILSAPPNLAQNIATQTVQNLTSQSQNLTLINNSNTLTLQINNSGVSALQTPAVPININALLSNTALNQPVLANNIAPSTPINNTVLQTTSLPPLSVSQLVSASQTINSVQSNALIQTIAQSGTNIAAASSAQNAPPSVSQNIAASLQPIVFDPANPNIVTVKNTPQLDVQIVRILPPSTQLVSPLNALQGAVQSQPVSIIPAATQFTTPILSNASATAITAKVTGITAQGLPLITAKFPNTTLPQSFILQYKSNNLVLGSQIQISPKSAPVLTPLAVAPQPINPLLQGFQWPALDELYNSLLQISPQAASSLSRSLPSASNSSQMGAAAMMFISAVKTGDMSGFLGDKKIDLLQRAGRENLLSRLVQSDGGARAAPEAAVSSEWRAVPLPMFWEGEIQRITLYTRHENQGDGENNQNDKNGSTRFVFDLDLTRMGKVQLDGFLKDQRLDLIIRTQNAFSQPMQQTMRQSYSSALDQTTLSGDLNFQGNIDNWVQVLENEKNFGADA